MRTPEMRSVVVGLLLLLSGVMPAVADPPIESEIQRLLAKMSLADKVGQMCLGGRGSRGSYDPLPDELLAGVRAGRLGAVINIMDRELAERLQRLAVEEGPHGIPLLFGRDVIHGFRTVFPIPLGQATAWDGELVRSVARASAVEASRFGVNWAFAPMLDVSRDPRWGRIAESFGEDPYLSSVLGVAMVEGLQGGDLSRPTSLAACVKHFAAYGAAEGGRDYNTVAVPETVLRNVYLPPFEATIAAGAASVMSGFNDLNGVPATANAFLLEQVLRDEWRFDGFVVSDWSSITEMIAHGTSADPVDAAAQAAAAGLDMDMMSGAFGEHLERLVTEGLVDAGRIDQAVAGILRVKLRLGLFDDPYRRSTIDAPLLAPATLDLARRAVARTSVLLKNEDNLLPLSAGIGRVAVVGPLADAPHEQLGTWTFDGRAEDSRTPLTALRQRLGERLLAAPGLATSRDRSRAGFEAALAAARAADVTLFFGGEEAILSGEAHSRADLRLPGAQEELLRELAATGKPLVLVILAGRPITLHGLLEHLDAVLVAWHPGTMAGPGLADVIFGDVEPGGRLPVTWPKTVGQVPIYYNHKNTGRPPPADLIPIEDIPVGAWQSSLSNTSHYLDLGAKPAFPFGFGLGYTRFKYRDLKVEPESVSTDGTVTVSAVVENTGRRPGGEVVQVYVRDLVASLTRPVRELVGFERVELAPGEARQVAIEVPARRLGFWGGEGDHRLEPGRFSVWIGPNAAEGLSGQLELTDEPTAAGQGPR